MTLNGFLNQVWRIVRVGGVAALAATQGATHVAPSGTKALIIAAAVAFVEAGYRVAVPPSAQPVLAKYIAAIQAVAKNPAVEAMAKADVPAPVLSVAEQAIAGAGITPPA